MILASSIVARLHRFGEAIAEEEVEEVEVGIDEAVMSLVRLPFCQSSCSERARLGHSVELMLCTVVDLIEYDAALGGISAF